MQGMVSLAACSAARTASSTESRSTPGIDGTGARRPSLTNSGQIRSSVVSTLSRTIRRAHSLRRLRRGRMARSSAGVASRASLVSTGTTRTRDSIGRPYLMAMNGSSMPRCFTLSGAGPPAPPGCYGRSRSGPGSTRNMLLPILKVAALAYRDAYLAAVAMPVLAAIAAVLCIGHGLILFYLFPALLDEPKTWSEEGIWFVAYVVLNFPIAPFLIAIHRYILLDEVTRRYAIAVRSPRFM